MPDSTTDRFSAPLASNEFPLKIAHHAVYKDRIAFPGMVTSLRIGGWVVNGRALKGDIEAYGWLKAHGFRESCGDWYRRDMTLTGLLELKAWARSAIGETPPASQRTPGNWVLRRTSIVSSRDENIEIAQVLTDDEIDADGNLRGRGLADGQTLAAAPFMLSTLSLIASDDRVPIDLRERARQGVVLACGYAPAPIGDMHKAKEKERARSRWRVVGQSEKPRRGSIP
ncbi:hypothetical protein J2W35_006444 [Variovorax boronicumulans]|uniref:hypothetical protein n=1 Tax=Variovorax boronicumulans TaxID=436515 RepID=UPI0027822EAF|nr:hypothetical protein [Variovorax boronicumulans]MDQ0086063.1 hypothetical protein [Variovorax boronicumulans]